jgi:SAM-dependent methyltransferase
MITTIRTFITCTLLLLHSAADAEPRHQDMPTRQRTVENFQCSELLRGDGAPTMAAIVQAVRVALRSDPLSSLEVDEQTKSIRVEANSFGLAKTERLIKSMQKADTPAKRLTGAQLYIEKRSTRDGTGKEFFGREISQVMGHLGAGWLERPSREKEERSSKMIDLLAISDGDDVADIGAGTGYFSFPIAERTPTGTVFAVDIQPEMLEFIESRKRVEKVTNVEGKLGDIQDIRLEANSIDLAFAVDAYHEFSHPWEMLASIRKALRPGGRIILVEYRLEDPEVPIKRLHKMSEAQARKELEAAGFEHVKTERELPWQHVLIFRKPLE